MIIVVYAARKIAFFSAMTVPGVFIGIIFAMVSRIAKMGATRHLFFATLTGVSYCAPSMLLSSHATIIAFGRLLPAALGLSPCARMAGT